MQDSQKPIEGKHELGDTGNLMEKVADANNLHAAWKRVRANKGSSGIDGQTVEEFERKALSHILEMRFLMENGCMEYQAWELAMSRKGWYRMALSPQAHKAMGAEWFRRLGLIPIAIPK